MSLVRTLVPDEMRHWLAFGSGVGIEISGAPGEESLRATLVRVRPGQARILDTFNVEALDRQGSGVWGTEFAWMLYATQPGRNWARDVPSRRNNRPTGGEGITWNALWVLKSQRKRLVCTVVPRSRMSSGDWVG